MLVSGQAVRGDVFWKSLVVGIEEVSPRSLVNLSEHIPVNFHWCVFPPGTLLVEDLAYVGLTILGLSE